jgi:MEMO1 family protein
MRSAAVAGQFYYSNADKLNHLIEDFMSSLDVSSQKSKRPGAGIVPHAGYLFSGKCASYFYKLLKNQEFDSFIILGTNHSGLGSKISLSIEDFDSPLGIVESDILLIEKIIKSCESRKIEVSVSEQAHKYEHSIEVQLPFIGFVQKRFRIVPILVQGLDAKGIRAFGKVLADLVADEKKKILVIASSDFTHYGASYGFTPFLDNIKQNLYEIDGRAIDRILDSDLEGFMDIANKSTICGKIPIACCMEFCRNLGLKGEKLNYTTSGDISGDWRNCVGYASIAFFSNP